MYLSSGMDIKRYLRNGGRSLQAQVPICGWLMVIPWCVTLSGCQGWLLRSSNYFLYGDLGLFWKYQSWWRNCSCSRLCFDSTLSMEAHIDAKATLSIFIGQRSLRCDEIKPDKKKRLFSFFIFFLPTWKIGSPGFFYFFLWYISNLKIIESVRYFKQLSQLCPLDVPLIIKKLPFFARKQPASHMKRVFTE